MLRSFATLQPMLAALHARAVLPPPMSDSEDERDDGQSDMGEAAGPGGRAYSSAPSARSAPAGGAHHHGGGSNHPAGSGGGAGAGKAPAHARGPGSVLGAPGARGGGGVSASGVGRSQHGGILLTELAGMYLADLADQVGGPAAGPRASRGRGGGAAKCSCMEGGGNVASLFRRGWQPVALRARVSAQPVCCWRARAHPPSGLALVLAPWPTFGSPTPWL
jgi:hypothetical protein